MRIGYKSYSENFFLNWWWIISSASIINELSKSIPVIGERFEYGSYQYWRGRGLS
jgi:hypothetical protein